VNKDDQKPGRQRNASSQYSAIDRLDGAVFRNVTNSFQEERSTD